MDDDPVERAPCSCRTHRWSRIKHGRMQRGRTICFSVSSRQLRPTPSRGYVSRKRSFSRVSPTLGTTKRTEIPFPTVIDRLAAAGARDAFITDTDTGYMHSIDIRAHCEDRDQALAIARQMVPISPPFHEGLIKPWAPGRKLTKTRWERACMSQASSAPIGHREMSWSRRSGRSARMERGPVESCKSVCGRPRWFASKCGGDIWAAMQKHKVALDVFSRDRVRGMGFTLVSGMAGSRREQRCLPCRPSVYAHRRQDFLRLFRWLDESGVKSATYSLYNRMRP